MEQNYVTVTLCTVYNRVIDSRSAQCSIPGKNHPWIAVEVVNKEGKHFHREWFLPTLLQAVIHS